MNEITCNRSCRMKSDLQKCKNKLPFLRDNWPTFGQIESAITLSRDEQICSLCLLDVMLDAIAKKKYTCPKEDIIFLVKSRLYILMLL